MPSNCPAIASGYSKPCRDYQAGVKKFWVTEHANIESYTESSGVLTAITLAAGKKFWLYEQEFQNAFTDEAPQSSRESGATNWVQTLTVQLNKRSSTLSYQLRAILHQDVVVIAQEQTGTNFIYGIKNGLSVDPSTAPSGKNTEDHNGYIINLTGKEPYGAFTISTDIIEAND